MHKRIRLTGRKQLSPASFNVSLAAIPGRKVITFAPLENALKGFASNARISLRLVENKFVEYVDLGRVDSPLKVSDVSNQFFAAPSCQIRISAADEDKYGILLASTDTWTLELESSEGDKEKKGILNFQPLDLAPRIWRLDIQENDYPIVYVDKNIPDARGWARTDPTFTGCVLPEVLSRVFEDILDNPAALDIPWMKDWLIWADVIMPGRPAPFASDDEAKSEWITGVVDNFCFKYKLASQLFDSLRREGESA
jgi:hypothetical protein